MSLGYTIFCFDVAGGHFCRKAVSLLFSIDCRLVPKCCCPSFLPSGFISMRERLKRQNASTCLGAEHAAGREIMQCRDNHRDDEVVVMVVMMID